MSSIPMDVGQGGLGALGASPLSAEQLALIGEAEKRGKKIRRARMVALTDGWLTAGFSGVTLLTGIFSMPSLLLGAAMGAIAANSFRGAGLLKNVEVRAARVLAINQVMLAGVLVAYAGYSIWVASRGDDGMSAAVNAEPGLGASLGQYQRLIWLLTLAVYGGLVAGTVVAQGLAAWYYASRGKYLRAYMRDTPAWIVELQRVRG